MVNGTISRRTYRCENPPTDPLSFLTEIDTYLGRVLPFRESRPLRLENFL